MMEATIPGGREGFAELQGLRMHFVTCGEAGNEPVLLLHGFPEFWYSWRFQMPALAAEGYFAIAPDQRGYNLTEKRPPYDIETLVNDLVHLLDYLGIARCHVVGHDWGGVTAWSLASYHPERVKSLCIMNAPHPNAYLDAVKSFSSQLFKSWYIYMFQIPRLPEWVLSRKDYKAIRNIFSVVPEEYMSAEDVEHYVTAISRPGALEAAIGWYREIPKQTRKHGGSLPNPQIDAPTLVIWGENDPALDVACNATLERYVPQLKIVYLPEASHWVQLDHPEIVTENLLDFLYQHR